MWHVWIGVELVHSVEETWNSLSQTSLKAREALKPTKLARLELGLASLNSCQQWWWSSKLLPSPNLPFFPLFCCNSSFSFFIFLPFLPFLLFVLLPTPTKNEHNGEHFSPPLLLWSGSYCYAPTTRRQP